MTTVALVVVSSADTGHLLARDDPQTVGPVDAGAVAEAAPLADQRAVPEPAHLHVALRPAGHDELRGVGRVDGYPAPHEVRVDTPEVATGVPETVHVGAVLAQEGPVVDVHEVVGPAAVPLPEQAGLVPGPVGVLGDPAKGADHDRRAAGVPRLGRAAVEHRVRLVHPDLPDAPARGPVVDGHHAAVVAAHDDGEPAVGQQLGVVRR